MVGLNAPVFIYEIILLVIGLWFDPTAPSGGGKFLQHVALYHSSALVFLIGDVFLLLGVGTLTGMQAVQVCSFIRFYQLSSRNMISPHFDIHHWSH